MESYICVIRGPLASLNKLLTAMFRIKNNFKRCGIIVFLYLIIWNLESLGPGSYVPVALGGGSRDGEVPVLAAQVVGVRPGVVPLPGRQVI